MDKQDKQLLLKDLCARLPYSVQVLYFGRIKRIEPLSSVHLTDLISDGILCKPYLRPMSSMTDEEIKEWDNICVMMRNMPVESIPMIVRFVNSKHLDYYNLIPKGLALPAPEGMYNF